MINRIEFEAKTLKEAEEIAVKELNTELEFIRINVLREKKGILGFGATTVYEAYVELNLAFEGKKYLESIFNSLEIDVTTEFRHQNEGKEIHYLIQSDHNALLIGSDGKTLSALQSLLRLYVSKISPKRVFVTLDIGGYKANRKKQLEILATKTAKEVAFTGIEAKLDPMNSYERRVIHTKLSEWRDVFTESEGEEQNRHVVIKPKKKQG